MSLRVALAGLLLTLTGAAHGFAWNALGHKVVAEIAWRQLEPAERQSIVDTLKRHPRFGEDFVNKMTVDVATADEAVQGNWIFQHASYWPDIARGLQGNELKRYNRPTWHYVTNPLFLDSSDRRALAGQLRINNSTRYPSNTRPAEFNVLQAIKYCQAALSNPGGSRNSKALAYCWLFHLVGDIHQPLHSTSLYSANQFPDGDRGGNEIPLVGGANLHSRWDGLLGRRNLMRDVDREVAELSNASRYGDVWNSAVANVIDPRKWADESHALCKSVVYSDAILNAVRQTPAGTTIAPNKLPQPYMQQAGDVARRRIIIAGLRLGRLLGGSDKRPGEEERPAIAQPALADPPTSLQLISAKPEAELTHWLNTSSNVRHNSSCKWYGATKRGRYCRADEGKPCGECGG